MTLYSRIFGGKSEVMDDVPRQLPEFVDMVDDVPLDFGGPLRLIEGAVPEGVDLGYWAGGWFRTPSRRIDHLLDCYSSAISVRIRTEGSSVLVRRCDDDVYDAEMAAGRILHRGMFTNRGGGLLSRMGIEFGRNAIHDCVAWGGRVLASTHGIDYWLDPRTLEQTGADPLASVRRELSGSAILAHHPRIDQRTGRLVTYTYSVSPTFASAFEFFEIEATGEIAQRRRYALPRFMAPHAFGQTEHHYVVPEVPARFPSIRAALGLVKGILDGVTDDANKGVVLHVVPRDPDAEPFEVRFSLHGYIYHCTNCFEQDGKVVLDAFVSNLNPERESTQFRLDSTGPVYTNLGGVFRFTIDPVTKTGTKRLLVPRVQRITFDAIDESKRGSPYRYAWFAANDQHEGHSSSLTRADTHTGELQHWHTDERLFLRQPRIVGSEDGQAWLVVPAYTPDETRFMLFDAHDLPAGPVAVLGAGRRLPYSNHGCAQ